MTWLYSHVGDWIFPFLFMVELVETLLHFGSMMGYIKYGRKFNEATVRFNFFIELVSLHFCFWNLHYESKSIWPIILMAPHYVFHILSNFYSIIIELDDFSEPFPPEKKDIAKWVLRWDAPCHLFNVISLSIVLGPLYTVLYTAFVVAFISNFPEKLIYAKTQEITKKTA